MKMKEDSWSMGKLDSEAYERHVKQEELKDKQRRRSSDQQKQQQQQQQRQQQDKPVRVEDYKLRHQEKRSKHQQQQQNIEQSHQYKTHLTRHSEKQQRNHGDGRLPPPVDQVQCGAGGGDDDDEDHEGVGSKKPRIFHDNVHSEGDTNVINDLDARETLEERLSQLRADRIAGKEEGVEASTAPGALEAGAQVGGQTAQAKQQAKQSKREENNVNLSFCGCGFLGIYHVGVASCFHEYAPQLSMHKISGSSAGALVAMAHICGNLQLAYCTTDILAVAIEARSHTLGPFHPSFDIQASVRESLERGLPEDAWQMATGKLHVSLTRVEDGENVIINEFSSNEDLIQVLLCSCFIPFWSGIRLPKYQGVAYIDGGFSDNLLILDDKTVTVSPFVGEADICPQDDTLNLLQISLSNTSFSVSPSNLYRLSHALLPPEPEVLSDLCKQGFADGIKYLQKMNLISCTKCLEIRSSLLVTTHGEDMEEVLSINHERESVATASSLVEYSATTATMTSTGETSSLHHIILEQQEQKMIEIGDTPARRRSSFVAATTAAAAAAAAAATASITSQQPARSITPSISLRNLLSGKLEDDEELEVVEDAGFEEVLGHGNARNVRDAAHCNECTLIRQKALYDPLPKQFSDRIRDACDKVNKSLSNWIYSHRPVKYLSYLMVPYYLPIDLTIALVYKCWKKLPWIRSEASDFVAYMLDALIVFLRRMQSRSTSAMLMGFGASWEEDVIAYEKELYKQQQEKLQVHHHHHHHHHHHRSSVVSATSSGGNGGSNCSDISSLAGVSADSVSVSLASALDGCGLAGRPRASSSHLSLSSNSLHHGVANGSANGNNNGAAAAASNSSGPRELHSLEDTFDSIVDVNDEQEGRIFAYYFRDSKDRLRVTEIFDLERAASLSGGSSGGGSLAGGTSTCGLGSAALGVAGPSGMGQQQTSATAAAANQSSKLQKALPAAGASLARKRSSD